MAQCERAQLCSIIRRFEQCLKEGDARFSEELPRVLEVLRDFFNVEGIAERLRTCRAEEKKGLWRDMKIMSTAADIGAC